MYNKYDERNKLFPMKKTVCENRFVFQVILWVDEMWSLYTHNNEWCPQNSIIMK